jgi:hypothetical protein
MHMSLKQEDARRAKLNGTGMQNGGMFGESNGPVDNVPSDSFLSGKRKCTEQSVPGQPTGCSSAVCLAVCNGGKLVEQHARPSSECLLSKRNKANVHSSADAGVEGIFALLGGGDGVTRGTRGGAQDGPQ